MELFERAEQNEKNTSYFLRHPFISRLFWTGSLKVFRLGKKMWFWMRPTFVRRNEYRLCKRGINNCVIFTRRLTVNSILSIAKLSPRDIVQCNLQNINVHLSHVFCILSKISLNIHLKALHSGFKTTDRLLWNTFQIMFTVTHSIQAALPLSTFCEVSSR